MIVVIPSAREVRLDYLEPLIANGARFIVVDDSPGSISVDHPQFSTYSWVDQDRILGKFARSIPRGTGACRDFGFYVAWRESDPEEIVVALDDDCCLEDADWATKAEESLSASSRPYAVGPGRHFNVLDSYVDSPADLFPRGFPYSERAEYQRFSFADETTDAPMFSLGLWKGVFDVNAIDKLAGPAFTYPDPKLVHDGVVVRRGQLVSACAMNMVFRREIIPAIYQLPMHVEVMPNWVVDRYGDIWGGFILKTLMDVRGDLMAVGAPLIRHLKEGNVQRNLWQEHLCHLLNDEFLMRLGGLEIPYGPYLDMVEAVANGLSREGEACSPPLCTYLKHLTPRLRAWIAALRSTA